MMRRVMCVWCPLWPVQRLLASQPKYRNHPLILFAESRRNLYVTACSSESQTWGVRVGMLLGEARSLLPKQASRRRNQATLRPIFQRADPAMDRAQLQALVLDCQQYSPLVGLEETTEPESFWLDVSGSEALFGGERGLIEVVRRHLAGQGIQVRIAIADTWGAAWAISHFAPSVESCVPSDGLANALRPLPVTTLRISDAVVARLCSLDLSTIGRVMGLPRASLPSRFGKELARRLDQALGLAPELLRAERLVEPICVDWPFEEAVTDRQTLEHVCEVLLERVLTILDQRRVGLRELSCHWLGTTTEPISLRLLRPTTDRRHLFDLLRLQCERCVFLSGGMGVRMEVLEMGFPPVRQAILFDDDREGKDEQLLAELIDRLSSRLGCQAILGTRLQPDPLPEFSYRCDPWRDGQSAQPSIDANETWLRHRPLRLLRDPQSLRVEQSSRDGLPVRVNQASVVGISGPERIESGWWRGKDRKRDYYRLDLANGTRMWVFCDLSSGQWFLHGLFS